MEQWEELTDNKWVLSIVEVQDKSESIYLLDIARRDRRTSQETAVERVQNQGALCFLFSAIPSAKKKDGKLRPAIDLSLLNQYINRQHFKM